MQLDILSFFSYKNLHQELQNEVQELLSKTSYEITINDSTKLDFLLDIINKESNKEILKKAENLIMNISSLQHKIRATENDRRREEREKSGIFRRSDYQEEKISEKTRLLLQRIGIEDEKIMAKAEGLFGIAGIEERVDFISIAGLGEELTKKLFRGYPELILIPKLEDFLAELDIIKLKKEMLDGISLTRKLPLWLDYIETPGILIDSYRDIQRQLAIETPMEVIPSESQKQLSYVPRTMTKKEFIKTLGRLGFVLVRQKNELVFQGPKLLITSNPHDGEYDPVMIRKIIRDIGITPDEFERARGDA